MLLLQTDLLTLLYVIVEVVEWIVSNWGHTKILYQVKLSLEDIPYLLSLSLLFIFPGFMCQEALWQRKDYR